MAGERVVTYWHFPVHCFYWSGLFSTPPPPKKKPMTLGCHFLATCLHFIQSSWFITTSLWRYREHVAPERQYLPSVPLGVAFQRTTMWTIPHPQEEPGNSYQLAVTSVTVLVILKKLQRAEHLALTKEMKNIQKSGGSHWHYSVLQCDAAQFGRQTPCFWRTCYLHPLPWTWRFPLPI